MNDKKQSTGAALFYIFLIIFILIGYLNKKGLISKLPINLSGSSVAVQKKNTTLIEFTDRAYDEDYSLKYAGQGIAIAGFEKSEGWAGDFDLDDINFWEGETSMGLVSKNGKTEALNLTKSVDLSTMEVIKMMVNVPKEGDKDNVAGLKLIFTNPIGNSFEYSITNLQTGWNLVVMPKSQFTTTSENKKNQPVENPVSKLFHSGDPFWSNIAGIRTELTSRPNTQIELAFDRLWAEQNNSYQNDFITVNGSMLSLSQHNGKTFINAWPMGTTSTLIKRVTAVKNFTYTVKFFPQKSGVFGISARVNNEDGSGYYLEVNGIDTNAWQLTKTGVPVNGNPVVKLDDGAISNFVIEKDKPLWLRLKLDGSKITGLLSIDGDKFTRLTEKNDDEITIGGIGIRTNASVLIENIDLRQ